MIGLARGAETMTETRPVLSDLRQVVVCMAAGSLPPVPVALRARYPVIPVTTLPGGQRETGC